MKINYEFHLTVKDVKKEDFINFCKSINVKPILLELQNKENVLVLNDTMTSHHRLLSNDIEAIEEMNRIKTLLISSGFKVIRDKIEADINHPDLTETFEVESIGNYFETHFNVLTDKENLEKLQNIAKKYNCHFSKNIFKSYGKEFTIMLTYRKYIGRIKEFQKDISEIKKALEKSFKIEKEIVEYSIYDSKENHDQKWLDSTQE